MRKLLIASCLLFLTSCAYLEELNHCDPDKGIVEARRGSYIYGVYHYFVVLKNDCSGNLIDLEVSRREYNSHITDVGDIIYLNESW